MSRRQIKFWLWTDSTDLMLQNKIDVCVFIVSGGKQ